MKIVIVGGGIGGLTAALCFLHHGSEVTVLEQAAALGEVGAGIQVPPNAMKVFEALGMAEALAETAFQPEALEARLGRSGRQLLRIPLAAAARARWGSLYLHMHRADYIAVLAAAVRAKSPDAIKLGAEFTHYEQDAHSVRAHLADGTEHVGHVLIGADGIHSAVRRQMLGVQKPLFTGNVAWRAVVPLEKLGKYAPRPTACVWLGNGKHCVTYRLRRGALANFVGVVEREDWTKESWSARGTNAEALADFDGWHPTITCMLSQAKTLYRWALFERAPLAKWVDGRAALLGDAAHPMLPFMAQGAAMAVEDAWVAAHSLSDGKPVHDALRTYQAQRYARATKTQAASRANAKTFHKRTRLRQFAAYAPMWLAGKISPMAIHKRQDALYGYDVTAL